MQKGVEWRGRGDEEVRKKREKKRRNGRVGTKLTGGRRSGSGSWSYRELELGPSSDLRSYSA